MTRQSTFSHSWQTIPTLFILEVTEDVHRSRSWRHFSLFLNSRLWLYTPPFLGTPNPETTTQKRIGTVPSKPSLQYNQGYCPPRISHVMEHLDVWVNLSSGPCAERGKKTFPIQPISSKLRRPSNPIHWHHCRVRLVCINSVALLRH